MRKKILAATMAVATGLGVFMYLDASTLNRVANDLTLANIEALTKEENDPMCSFSKVSLDEDKHELKCSGSGHQCCILR